MPHPHTLATRLHSSTTLMGSRVLRLPMRHAAIPLRRATITSSRIEWAFVARPTEEAAFQPYLAALGHYTGEWPQDCRGGEMPYSE